MSRSTFEMQVPQGMDLEDLKSAHSGSTRPFHALASCWPSSGTALAYLSSVGMARLPDRVRGAAGILIARDALFSF